MAAGARPFDRTTAPAPSVATPAGPVAPVATGAAWTTSDVIPTLARGLLAAVVLDLVVTRFLVRLAIFVPKGEPWATASSLLGRVGAATDVLVPIVGLLLLGAMLVRAGRSGDRIEQALLLGVAIVAAGGLALVVLAPTAALLAALELTVVAVAAGAGAGLTSTHAYGRAVRLGLGLLAAAIALGAGSRAVVALDAAGLSIAPAAAVGALVTGQVAFVTAAAVLGLAGLAVAATARRRDARPWVPILLGLVVFLVASAMVLGSPRMAGAFEIWSIGLAGIVPGLVVAAACGLAVAGLPALHRSAPRVAVGSAIVLLAGFGLAASGLVLAGLLGLVVVRPAGQVPPAR